MAPHILLSKRWVITKKKNIRLKSKRPISSLSGEFLCTLEDRGSTLLT